MELVVRAKWARMHLQVPTNVVQLRQSMYDSLPYPTPRSRDRSALHTE